MGCLSPKSIPLLAPPVADVGGPAAEAVVAGCWVGGGEYVGVPPPLVNAATMLVLAASVLFCFWGGGMVPLAPFVLLLCSI